MDGMEEEEEEVEEEEEEEEEKLPHQIGLALLTSCLNVITTIFSGRNRNRRIWQNGSMGR